MSWPNSMSNSWMRGAIDTPSDLARLHDYYKYKFQGLEFDVIIASDNAALDFLLQNHQALFPQTPVVFCGVGMMARDYDFSKRPLFTGILEVTDIVDTIALALRLHPEARRVVVITDNQPALRTGQSEPPHLEDVFPQVEFIVLDPLDLELSGAS